jgi:NADH:quinone reductase (non-electrogenic)
VALGASTNEQLIPGSSNAFTFKTMADALVLRNHLIEQFERADATSKATTRREHVPRAREMAAVATSNPT